MWNSGTNYQMDMISLDQRFTVHIPLMKSSISSSQNGRICIGDFSKYSSEIIIQLLKKVGSVVF
jgi:hypothetical protein